jgi:hypothetical protein
LEVVLFGGIDGEFEEDLSHAGVGFVFFVDDTGGDADLEVGVFLAEFGDSLGDVFEDCGAGPEEHGEHEEGVDAFGHFLFDEGLEDLGGFAVEVCRVDFYRMKEGDGVHMMSCALADGGGEFSQAKGGLGPVGAVVGDHAARGGIYHLGFLVLLLRLRT